MLGKTVRALWMGLAMVLPVGFIGCGGTAEPVKQTDAELQTDNQTAANPELATPDKTLASIKSVDASRNYGRFCQHFTPEAQQALAGGLLMSGKFLKAIIDNPDNRDQMSDEDRQLVQAVDSLLQKHGVEKDLDIRINPESEGEIQQTKGEEPTENTPPTEQQILQKMGGQLKDQCLFVTDFIKTMRTHGKNPNARIFEDNARLENLKTEGDTAQAELVFTRDDKEVRRPIGFQNVSGEWRISQIPDVLFK